MSQSETDHKRQDWTTAELAEAAGVSSTRIRQLIAENRLQGYQRGRWWFIPDSVARIWLANRPDKEQE